MKLQFSPGLDGLRGELAGLLALWRAAIPADGGLPPRGDFDPFRLKPWLPHVFVVEYHADSGRYRFRLIGTGIVATYGRDSTGKYFDDLYAPEEAAAFRDGYDLVRRSNAPARFFGTLFFVGRDHMQMDALVLPLAFAAGENRQFLCAIYFTAAEA